jgi:enoyl-CoA hydratase
MADILVDELAPEVARITFNRPETLNGFRASMYPELLGILEKIGQDPKTRVVVITGAGRGFCSGNDGAAPSERPWVPENVGKVHRSLHFMKPLNALGPALRNLPQPVIAAVNGPAAGIGYSLALACDIAIAAKSAKFVNAFHNAGTGSEIGLSYLLPRAVGMQRAAELLLTARPVMAEEAERMGLVLKAVPDDKLMEEVLKIAQEMIQNAPLDLWVTKQNMYANLDAGSLEHAVLLETRASLIANATEDIEEKRAARREKRAPKFHNK